MNCTWDCIKAYQKDRGVDEQSLRGRAEDPDGITEKLERGFDEPYALTGKASTDRSPVESPTDDARRPNPTDQEKHD
jgi:hypothetical protein